MDEAFVIVLVCAGVLVLVALCAALCVRIWSFCFPFSEPEIRTRLTDPNSWMVASYPTQVVAAYPDPWDERSPDVVIYRPWC